MTKINDTKKVSIVLPVYNGAEHIADSINSIILQTYENWELIIVDDCSTDSTLQICRDIAQKDDRIKIVSNERNLKLPNTLNTGFRQANGYYYTWTSDDNMYKSIAIETMVGVLEANPDVAMVYSDYTNIDADGNVLDECRLQNPEYIVTGNVCGACFLYTAEIAKKVGEYDATLFLAEDYDYWMRIYRYGKVMHLSDNLYLYRRHMGSLTETKRTSIKEQTYRALEKNFLPLYANTRSQGLRYAFFDHMLVRAEFHVDETKEMLLSVDKGYEHFLNRKRIKGSIKEIIRDTAFFKMLRTSKGISR